MINRGENYYKAEEEDDDYRASYVVEVNQVRNPTERSLSEQELISNLFVAQKRTRSQIR